MLILGRRPNQSIVFPSCGITVRILDVNGRVAKIGIEAPRRVEIMRGELVPASTAVSYDDNSLGSEQEDAHEDVSLMQFSQRLAEIKSMLHAFQQYRAMGNEAKADQILADLLEGVAGLDRDCMQCEPERVQASTESVTDFVSEPLADYRSASMRAESTRYVLVVHSPDKPCDFSHRASEYHGYQICSVNCMTSAQQAIACNEPFDFIVCNVSSEDSESRRFVESVRAKSQYERSKLFVVRGGASTLEQIQTAHKSGIDGWLTEPLSSAELWNHIVESHSIER
jgi:carbon storage regulator CsrA